MLGSQHYTFRIAVLFRRQVHLTKMSWLFPEESKKVQKKMQRGQKNPGTGRQEKRQAHTWRCHKASWDLDVQDQLHCRSIGVRQSSGTWGESAPGRPGPLASQQTQTNDAELPWKAPEDRYNAVSQIRARRPKEWCVPDTQQELDPDPAQGAEAKPCFFPTWLVRSKVKRNS